MGNWFIGMFKSRQAARPAAPVPTPEPVEDPQAQQDAELRERIAASHAALVEKILRDGTDGAGFTGDERGRRWRW